MSEYSISDLVYIHADELARNIRSKGVGSASADDGLHTLASKVLDISQAEDKLLKIIPSSQYVVADESFVISVLLCDGLGNGISGAEITLEGSDGSLNSGIGNECRR